jgi:hypothetical protein
MIDINIKKVNLFFYNFIYLCNINNFIINIKFIFNNFIKFLNNLKNFIFRIILKINIYKDSFEYLR